MSVPELDMPETITGTVRLDTRTKRLTGRLEPGDIAVIDHPDIDLVAAESLVAKQVGAVINVAESMTGRYPNSGPLIITEAGVPLIEGADAKLFDRVKEGQQLTIDG